MNAAVPTPIEAVPAVVKARLIEFFDATTPTVAAISPVVTAGAEHLRGFVLNGGKRVRPTFAWAGWQCAIQAGDTVDSESALADSADVVTLGAALELVQACALLHDDIIDRSDTRRGRPTVHRLYRAEHIEAGWSGEATHFGESAAILIGDLALAWADDLAAALPRHIAPIWSAMRTEVLGGQLLDIVNEASADESVDAALSVMRFKTAAYTVARPLELGAALGNASPQLISALAGIGHDLGLAFQLRDDLLGVFGDPETTGKPSGDDLISGKRTVLIADGLARARKSNPAAAQALRSALGTTLTDAELADARGILRDVGAVTAIEDRITEHLRSALNAIDSLPTSAGARTDLASVANAIAYRNA
ncbi:polyprenyl synthetase family protein [Gordonia effusa]|uniref:polyprenyl synthetase family protein n=1 Tax=Gordonia effusa TaxID=263908 RepID=UPI00058E4101|nr:polyprenyl synthetase family protein [Gordonia effusa]